MNILKIFFAISFIFFSCTNKSGKELYTEEIPIDDLTTYGFTSNERFLVKTISSMEILPNSSDTSFSTSIHVYETTLDFQKKYDLDNECDFDELDECDKDILFDESNFELIRLFKFEEKLLDEVINFTQIYGIKGFMEFKETEEDTVLKIKYLDTEISFSISRKGF